MASADQPYTRQQWNNLIEDVNELARACDEDELDPVEPNHRWGKRDVEEVQDKLIEVCGDNEPFEPIEDHWSKQKIDELEAAIEAGECCCEEDSIYDGVADSLDTFSSDGGFLIFINFSSVTGDYSTHDWLGWLREWTEAREPLSIVEITCPVEEGEPPQTIEIRTGGKMWVGGGCNTWEFYLWDSADPNASSLSETPWYTGPIIDGYMTFPGMSELRDKERCGEPAPTNGAAARGENDPTWDFPVDIDGTTNSWSVYATNSGFSAGPYPNDFFGTPGPLGLSIAYAPIVIERHTGSVMAKLKLKRT